MVLGKGNKQFNRLIKDIARKDKYALETFYEIYGKMIYTTALTVVKSPFIADEVVNDVLVKIWRIAPTIKKIDNAEGWLYSITINSAKDKIKYERNYREIFDIAIDDNQIDKILDEDEFFNEIKDLNEVEQNILILKFLCDLTFEQIAKQLKKSVGYVSATYYRALYKIKSKLE